MLFRSHWLDRVWSVERTADGYVVYRRGHAVARVTHPEDVIRVVAGWGREPTEEGQ